jgi:hypothetical protein
MKLMSIVIALAMLTMLLEGCGRYTEDGQTVGQKLDRVFNETNLAIINAGDALGARVEDANSTTMMSSVASTMSERALITTLAVADSAITAAVMTDLIKDPALGATKIDVETRDGVVSLNGLASDEEGRVRAERIARANKAVVQVNNYLTVKRT